MLLYNYEWRYNLCINVYWIVNIHIYTFCKYIHIFINVPNILFGILYWENDSEAGIPFFIILSIFFFLSRKVLRKNLSLKRAKAQLCKQKYHYQSELGWGSNLSLTLYRLNSVMRPFLGYNWDRFLVYRLIDATLIYDYISMILSYFTKFWTNVAYS